MDEPGTQRTDRGGALRPPGDCLRWPGNGRRWHDQQRRGGHEWRERVVRSGCRRGGSERHERHGRREHRGRGRDVVTRQRRSGRGRRGLCGRRELRLLRRMSAIDGHRSRLRGDLCLRRLLMRMDRLRRRRRMHAPRELRSERARSLSRHCVPNARGLPDCHRRDRRPGQRFVQALQGGSDVHRAGPLRAVLTPAAFRLSWRFGSNTTRP